MKSIFCARRLFLNKKYGKISTQDLAGITPSPEYFFRKPTQRDENKNSEKEGQDKDEDQNDSTKLPDREIGLGLYRQTLKLLKQQGQSREMFEESLKYIRTEYKKSGLLPNEESRSVYTPLFIL